MQFHSICTAIAVLNRKLTCNLQPPAVDISSHSAIPYDILSPFTPFHSHSPTTVSCHQLPKAFKRPITTMLTNSLIQDSLLLLIAICIVKLVLLTQPPKGLPPSPRPLPILGNIKDMPPKGGRDWEHWAKFKELYGPIGSLTTLGTTLIIISDYNLAVELLDKQSSISSDRAQPTFLADM